MDNKCLVCLSEKGMELKEGSIDRDGVLSEHGGGSAYLQCRHCGTLFDSVTHEVVKQ